MSRTISHRAMLQGAADVIWEECKHADQILCDLMPEYFGQCEFANGCGEPGSVRVITMGPASFPHAGQVQERWDKVDDATKTLSYTVYEPQASNPSYSAFTAELRFVENSRSGSTTEATWTAKYEAAAAGDAPEHLKTIAAQMLTALERAVGSMKTLTHTETIDDIAPGAIWRACKNVDGILCQAMPQFFASSSVLKGHGEPGSVRVVKMGPAIPHVGEVTERMDVVDDATRKLGYTILKGDPRYKYFSATMQFTPGPSTNSTRAIWVARYIPEGDMGPPEHIKAIVLRVWKALAEAVKAHPELYYA